MDEMTCPQCQSPMEQHTIGDVSVSQCSSCAGIFLPRAGLGALIEAENDWHRHSGHKTEPIPRITAEMTAPPAAPPRVRAYVETLFG